MSEARKDARVVTVPICHQLHLHFMSTFLATSILRCSAVTVFPKFIFWRSGLRGVTSASHFVFVFADDDTTRVWVHGILLRKPGDNCKGAHISQYAQYTATCAVNRCGHFLGGVEQSGLTRGQKRCSSRPSRTPVIQREPSRFPELACLLRAAVSGPFQPGRASQSFAAQEEGISRIEVHLCHFLPAKPGP